jgi:hypothetical protein
MSGAIQATFMNQRSFGPPIGSAYEGGFYAGQISTTANGVATHNLVVGPLSTAEFTGEWKTSNTSTAGTTSVIDGPANTAAMIAAGAAAHPCAQFCDNLVTGGFSDWYMPAKNELEVCYFNLKPTTNNNNTSSGTNTNAVPSRASNYTTGTPAQTSALAFQDGGAQAFNPAATQYWVSTEFNAFSANIQGFFNGYQSSTSFYAKNGSRFVRAIRRVAV